MCEYIDKAEKIATNEEMLREHVSLMYSQFSADEIAEIRAQKEHWQHEAKIMRLGKQAKNIHLRLGEQEYSGDFVIRTGVGRRAEGAGSDCCS